MPARRSCAFSSIQNAIILGRVGRYKLNRKLGLGTTDEELAVVTLRKEDVIAALKYLIRLKMGDEHAFVDDIDHLATAASVLSAN